MCIFFGRVEGQNVTKLRTLLKAVASYVAYIISKFQILILKLNFKVEIPVTTLYREHFDKSKAGPDIGVNTRRLWTLTLCLTAAVNKNIANIKCTIVGILLYTVNVVP